MDISGNRQGENAVRFTLTTFHLPIQIIDPFHGLYIADFPKISLRLSTRLAWRKITLLTISMGTPERLA